MRGLLNKECGKCKKKFIIVCKEISFGNEWETTMGARKDVSFESMILTIN